MNEAQCSSIRVTIWAVQSEAEAAAHIWLLSTFLTVGRISNVGR